MIERVGIYGGSFNPIHFGHLNLALEMFEKKRLSKILFCPAAVSPFKKNEQAVLSADHRLAMIKLAIEEFPQFYVIENELNRAGPSYTVDTIEELIATSSSSSVRYFFILGEDLISGLPKWHRIHDLVNLVTFLVGTRALDVTSEIDNPVIRMDVNCEAVKTRAMEISSSELRKRIEEGKPCSHLMPKKVLNYIAENCLYDKGHK